MQPCVIDELLTTHEETLNLCARISSVGTLNSSGYMSYCFMTDSHGAKRSMLDRDSGQSPLWQRSCYLTEEQRSKRTIACHITFTDSIDRPISLRYRIMPAYISELQYNHIAYWGLRSMSPPPPTAVPKRGRISPFDKAIVTVDYSSISTPKAFCIGLAISPL
jgi:hypothetical protein